MKTTHVFPLRTALAIAAVAIMPAGFAQTPALAVPPLPPGQSLGIALGIPTVPNLRDVGGYKTADGATVARGLAYRSDTFNPMSAEDIKKLERVGLKNDYDLRTTSEVKAKPDEMPPGVKWHLLNVLADAKSAAPAELEALMHEPKKANVVLGNGKVEALFMDEWNAGEGPDNFSSDPPNATLSVYQPGQSSNALTVVEISHPVIEGSDLVYRYRLIEGTMPKTGGATALFIDWIGVGGGVGPGFHGVGVGARGVGWR